MSAAGEIVAVLQADTGPGGAVSLLPGGIYDYETLGRKGINRTDVPGAYDAASKLQPLAIVRERTVTPWSGRRDPDGYVAVRVVVDITLLTDGDDGWDGLEAARSRIQALIDQKTTTSWNWFWEHDIKARDQNLSDACLLRTSYRGYGKREW